MRSLLTTALLGALLAVPAASPSATTLKGPLDELTMQIMDTPPDQGPTSTIPVQEPTTSTLPLQAPASQDGQLVIAVLDTGVSAVTQQLSAAMLPGADFLSDRGTPDWADLNGHGTFVASVVLRHAPNAKILPVRVMNDEGRGDPDSVATAIRWAADNGADVVNASLGAPAKPALIELFNDAVTYAADRGVLVVAASGNQGEEGSTEYVPAVLPGVLSVGAVTSKGAIASFSNRGAHLDVTTVGQSVKAPTIASDTTLKSGTSFATPRVSAVAGLIKAANPQWTPTDVINHIRATATDKGVPGPDHAFGWGLLDTKRALASPLSMSSQAMPSQRLTNVGIQEVKGGVLVRGVASSQRVFLRHENGEISARTGAGFLASTPGIVSVWVYDRLTAGPTIPTTITINPAPLPELVVSASRSGKAVNFKVSRRFPTYVKVYLVIQDSEEWTEVAHFQGRRLRLDGIKLIKGIQACYELSNEDEVCVNVRIK
jgi:hypothetical protein